MQIVEEYKDEGASASLLPWLVCFSASLFFFYEFIQGNMFASIADNIMHDFHVQADKMAYLSSIYYLSNVLFLFVAGFVLDRFSTKKTILFAMLLCVMSTFILAHAHSFYLALFCRFVTGIGSAFCFLGPIRLASRWFPPQRMAMVTGVIVTMAMTGGMLAQYPLTKLVAQVGWRDALMQVGWLGMAMLLFMSFGIIEKAKIAHQKISQKISIMTAAKKAYLNPQTLRAALYTSLMNMAIAVFGAMMGSLYLVQRLGIAKEDAAIVNTMLFLGAIIGGPVVGWCSDKLGLRILPMKVGALASLVTILAVLYLPVSLPAMNILFFLLGFFTASQVISYALVAESSSPLMTATAVSVVSILTQGGYIIYQNLFSILLIGHGGMHMVNDIPVYSLGDYQFAAIILPLGLVLALLVLFGLKETRCRQVEE
ncbi:MFS transporter [Legionella jamestowniensis]|uniref:MFS transporter n=1 Tax=Legionella jamestowniensis TaxID=455 RepID=A0A0W0UH58_9GAMM|nr:MFS transporter [Legionella jamestowniensis]KTD07243.1 major facilitator family transporter [Legionella jamestowniensis]OCH98007.1 MFS transporter [Legionella jamestowniensis]SFL95771.1 Nitrate/nitrite transporter NarK [Legionella jamestowniensis DSM 19215]